MSKANNDNIFFVETNIHGAIVIYGNIGIRQYYYYTKTDARKAYLKECNKLLFNNVKGA